MEDWQPLNRWALLSILRVKANERFHSKKAMHNFFSGGDVRSLRSDPIRNRLSWDRMVQWLNKLGFTVEFRLVPKQMANYSARQLAPSARRNPLPVGVDVAAEEPLRNGSEGAPLSG